MLQAGMLGVRIAEEIWRGVSVMAYIGFGRRDTHCGCGRVKWGLV